MSSPLSVTSAPASAAKPSPTMHANLPFVTAKAVAGFAKLEPELAGFTPKPESAEDSELWMPELAQVKDADPFLSKLDSRFDFSLREALVVNANAKRGAQPTVNVLRAVLADYAKSVADEQNSGVSEGMVAGLERFEARQDAQGKPEIVAVFSETPARGVMKELSDEVFAAYGLRVAIETKPKAKAGADDTFSPAS